MKPPVTIQAKLARLKPVPFVRGKLMGYWVPSNLPVYIVTDDNMPVAAYFAKHPYWGTSRWLVTTGKLDPALQESLRAIATARRKTKPQILALDPSLLRLAAEENYPAPYMYGGRLITFS